MVLATRQAKSVSTHCPIIRCTVGKRCQFGNRIGCFDEIYILRGNFYKQIIQYYCITVWSLSSSRSAAASGREEKPVWEKVGVWVPHCMRALRRPGSEFFHPNSPSPTLYTKLYHFIFVFLKAHHNNTKLKRRVFLINRGTATGVSDVLAVLNSRSRSKKGKFQKKKTQIIKW